MTKPVLVYVGHSYHRVTNSTAFLLDILRRDYQVSVIWDEAWQPSAKPLNADDINALNPEIVLFFQTLPCRREMRRLHCKRLFHVPMHDHVVGNPKYGWSKFRGSDMRSINFCRSMHNFFTSLGYESLHVQYWPAPAVPTPSSNAPLSVFFWARRREIGWRTLKALLGDARPERIVLRAAADPGEPLDMPDANEIRDYRIEVVSGWLDKPRYLELLTTCSLFMAPRVHEGIGQSFLEAMSLGLAILAPDSPTMNEYIRHGSNGYLYPVTETMPAPVDFSDLAAIRVQSLQDVAIGHQHWQRQEQEILKYLGNTSAFRPSLGWRLRAMLGY